MKNQAFNINILYFEIWFQYAIKSLLKAFVFVAFWLHKKRRNKTFRLFVKIFKL